MKKIIYTTAILFFGIGIMQGQAQSLAYKLGTIEKGYVSKDDLIVKRFDNLLDQLSDKYVEDRQQVSDMTVKAKQILEDKGIDQSMIDIMEGMNLIFSGDIGGNQKYAEYVAAYITLREKGQSHDKAIRGLKGIVDTLMGY